MQNAVSIIIITHNNLECLVNSVDDILKYTSYKYELVIVDNNSTNDEVINYLNELECKEGISILRLNNNLYYFPAVNAGIKFSNSTYKYLLVLNDDIRIESYNWIQYLISILESEENVAYVGDFIQRQFCPPIGGWVDGWCMFFNHQKLNEIGLFDEKYIWWYGPADYAVRTIKLRYKIKDIKQEGDKLGDIRGIIKHIGGQTFEKIRYDPNLPLDIMFPADFAFYDLLYKHGLYNYWISARTKYFLYTVIRKITPKFIKEMIRPNLRFIR